MASHNFVVKNGLEVGRLTIFAGNGDISTPGNVTISGSVGVSSINKNDSSIAINDTGTGSTVVVTIDGTVEQTIDVDGIKLPAGDAYYINSVSVLNATTLGSGVINSSLTGVGSLNSLTVLGPSTTANITAGGIVSNGTIQAATVNAATIGNTNATLTGTLATASQPNVTTLGGVTSIGASFGSVTAQGNLTIVGNLTVQGNTITIGSNNLTVTDSIIDLHTPANLQPLISDDGRDIGFRFHYYKGSDDHAFFGWENTTETLVYLQRSDEVNSNITGTFGNVQIGSLLLANTTAATSTTSGALQVRGGVGISGSLHIANTGDVSANLGAYQTFANANVSSLQNQITGANTNIQTFNANLGSFQTYANTKIGTNSNSNLVVVATTAATSATTGALVVNGGVGIAGNVFTSGWIVPTANTTQNLGTSTSWWGTLFGVSTQARYADLAENYRADSNYEPGTVLAFGGVNEVTVAGEETDRVAGVVSTNPAHLMNGALRGSDVVPLALQGRVPCKVVGNVRKGDMMVAAGFGYAKASSAPKIGTVIGKALENHDRDKGVIEIVVGRL